MICREPNDPNSPNGDGTFSSPRPAASCPRARRGLAGENAGSRRRLRRQGRAHLAVTASDEAIPLRDLLPRQHRREGCGRELDQDVIGGGGNRTISPAVSITMCLKPASSIRPRSSSLVCERVLVAFDQRCAGAHVAPSRLRRSRVLGFGGRGCVRRCRRRQRGTDRVHRSRRPHRSPCAAHSRPAAAGRDPQRDDPDRARPLGGSAPDGAKPPTSVPEPAASLQICLAGTIRRRPHRLHRPDQQSQPTTGIPGSACRAQLTVALAPHPRGAGLQPRSSRHR